MTFLNLHRQFYNFSLSSEELLDRKQSSKVARSTDLVCKGFSFLIP